MMSGVFVPVKIESLLTRKLVTMSSDIIILLICNKRSFSVILKAIESIIANIIRIFSYYLYYYLTSSSFIFYNIYICSLSPFFRLSGLIFLYFSLSILATICSVYVIMQIMTPTCIFSYSLSLFCIFSNYRRH